MKYIGYLIAIVIIVALADGIYENYQKAQMQHPCQTRPVLITMHKHSDLFRKPNSKICHIHY